MEIEKERGFGDYLMIISDGFLVRYQRLNPVSRATHLSSWRLLESDTVEEDQIREYNCGVFLGSEREEREKVLVACE